MSATAAVSNTASANGNAGKTTKVQVTEKNGTYTAHVLSNNASGSASSSGASGKQEDAPPTATKKGLGGESVTGNQGNMPGQGGGRRKRTHRKQRKQRKQRSHKHKRTHRSKRSHKRSHKRTRR